MRMVICSPPSLKPLPDLSNELTGAMDSCIVSNAGVRSLFLNLPPKRKYMQNSRIRWADGGRDPPQTEPDVSKDEIPLKKIGAFEPV